jgi:hypothetical protein
LDSISNFDLLLAMEEIAQDHEHHKEHDNNHHATKEKTHEFTGGGTRHGHFPSTAKVDLGDLSSKG